MINLKPEEISSIIKEQISKYQDKTETTEEGVKKFLAASKECGFNRFYLETNSVLNGVIEVFEKIFNVAFVLRKNTNSSGIKTTYSSPVISAFSETHRNPLHSGPHRKRRNPPWHFEKHRFCRDSQR